MTCTKEKPFARVTKKEYEMLAEFRYRLRHFLRFSESAAEASGLTSRQYQALLAIRGFPARECVTIGQLAEQLQIAHHSAVGLVDRLVVQNLVSREAGANGIRPSFSLADDWAKSVDRETSAPRNSRSVSFACCPNVSFQSKRHFSVICPTARGKPNSSNAAHSCRRSAGTSIHTLLQG
jgi:hypothetical protein